MKLIIDFADYALTTSEWIDETIIQLEKIISETDGYENAQKCLEKLQKIKKSYKNAIKVMKKDVNLAIEEFDKSKECKEGD